MIDYVGQTVLVTGAASGIGRALATALAARGAHVALADVQAAAVEAAAAEIGPKAPAFTVDLAEPAAPTQLVADAFAWRGRLDLICSNAGIGRNKRLKNETLEDGAVERLFAVNLFAGLRIAQAYGRALEAKNATGRLMITASENSLSVPAAVKGAGLGLYAASKHGVLIMAEWLRDEAQAANAPYSVHALLPGAVYTPLVSKAIPDPANAPPHLGLIMPERCAELALKGLDLDLFYIPTHAHLADDMRPRSEGVADALRALGLC